MPSVLEIKKKHSTPFSARSIFPCFNLNSRQTPTIINLAQIKHFSSGRDISFLSTCGSITVYPETMCTFSI